MNFPQGLIFWSTVLTMLKFFYDIEQTRYIKKPKAGELQPVNRKLIDFSNSIWH